MFCAGNYLWRSLLYSSRVLIWKHFYFLGLNAIINYIFSVILLETQCPEFFPEYFAYKRLGNTVLEVYYCRNVNKINEADNYKGPQSKKRFVFRSQIMWVFHNVCLTSRPTAKVHWPIDIPFKNPKPTYEIISEIPKQMYKINTYSRLLNLLNSMLSIQPFEA